MSLKEIEKLKERVEKDPNSKLFVPLAEEYRKEGMLDDAISVLMGGIDRQPGYMSARVSLGKIFLEKGMTNEAREEFENVIKSIPDNLYAHKKLAEIYRGIGQKEMSIRSYRTVLKLNPLDEEALSNVGELEDEMRSLGETPSAEVEAHGETGAPLTAGIGEATVLEETLPEEDIHAAVEEAAPIDAGDLNAFKDSLFGDKTVTEDVDIIEEAPSDSAGEEQPIEDEQLEVVEELSENDEMSFADIGASVEETPPPAAVTMEEETRDDSGDTVELLEETAPAPLAGEPSKIEDADRFVAEGDYFRAMQVYRNIINADPDNRIVLQRMEELRTLLKLMGKDKDALIVRLNAFLDGITKRGHEFHGSS